MRLDGNPLDDELALNLPPLQLNAPSVHVAVQREFFERLHGRRIVSVAAEVSNKTVGEEVLGNHVNGLEGGEKMTEKGKRKG